MQDQRLPGEIPLSEVQALWLRKFGLHRTRVYDLVVKHGVVSYRWTPWKIYVNEREAHEYEHEYRRGRPKASQGVGAAV